MTSVDTEAIIANNIRLVDEHFHNENPDDVEKAVALYSDDIVWEAPSRGIVYRSADEVLKGYRAIFESLQIHEHIHINRFATEEWVFDDCIYICTKVGDAAPNIPFPNGTKMSVRLVHAFQIRDGAIARENAYEIWRRADDDKTVNDDIPDDAPRMKFD